MRRNHAHLEVHRRFGLKKTLLIMLVVLVLVAIWAILPGSFWV